MEKKKGNMEKEKKKYSQFGHIIFSSVELQKWKVYFYISTFIWGQLQILADSFSIYVEL